MASGSDPLPRFTLCVQCGRCSAGCPVAFISGHTPRKIIRFLQLGRIEAAGRSPFLWLCAMCQACTVRCPRGVDIAGIMLVLRRTAQRERWAASPPFYKAFKGMVEKRKRISELRLGFALARRKFPLHPLSDVLLIWRLWRRGKIR